MRDPSGDVRRMKCDSSEATSRGAPAEPFGATTRGESIGRLLVDVLCHVASAVVVVALLASSMPFFWQLVTGGSTLTVTGRSMLPTYDRGDVLFVERVQEPGPKFWEKGAVVVVSFDASKPDDDRYVHRVHRLLGRGEAVLKGDGNPFEDVSPVNVRQVYGVPLGRLSGDWANLYLFTQSVHGRIILFASGIMLLLLLDHVRHKASRLGTAPGSAPRRPRAHMRVLSRERRRPASRQPGTSTDTTDDGPTTPPPVQPAVDSTEPRGAGGS